MQSQKIWTKNRHAHQLPTLLTNTKLLLDGLPEQTFNLVGNIDKATAKAINLEMESNLKK